jgi:uncharacterized protein (DUF433 family)
MATVPGFDRITIEPGRMGGRPTIRGMRLSVQRVLSILATYDDREEIRREFPELEDEDIRQALAYASESMEGEIIDVIDFAAAS